MCDEPEEEEGNIRGRKTTSKKWTELSFAESQIAAKDRMQWQTVIKRHWYLNNPALGNGMMMMMMMMIDLIVLHHLNSLFIFHLHLLLIKYSYFYFSKKKIGLHTSGSSTYIVFPALIWT